MFFKITIILLAIFTVKAFSQDSLTPVKEEKTNKLSAKQLEIIKTYIKANSKSSKN